MEAVYFVGAFLLLVALIYGMLDQRRKELGRARSPMHISASSRHLPARLGTSFTARDALIHATDTLAALTLD